MDILEGIFTRRSIRKFTQQSVSKKDIETILRAGMQAPSAHNYRPWHFLVLTNKDIFGQITEFHPYAKMLVEAAVCIVVCGDSTKESRTGFLVENCSAAIQNMLLAIHGLGLGAVWCGLYPITKLTEGISRVCELPPDIVPIGMVVLGHGAEEKQPENRFEPDKVHYEKWS